MDIISESCKDLLKRWKFSHEGYVQNITAHGYI